MPGWSRTIPKVLHHLPRYRRYLNHRQKVYIVRYFSFVIMIKGIIFDYGGVIRKSPAECIHRRVADSFGLSVHEVREKSRKLMHLSKIDAITPEEFWHKIGEHLSIQNICSLKNIWLEEFKIISFVDERVVSLIKKMKKYKLCLLANVSNIYKDVTDSRYDYLFDEVVRSYEVKCRKPDKKIYMIALNRLGLRAQECIIIDDQEQNLISARELGLRTIRYESCGSLVKSLRSLSIEVTSD